MFFLQIKYNFGHSLNCWLDWLDGWITSETIQPSQSHPTKIITNKHFLGSQPA